MKKNEIFTREDYFNNSVNIARMIMFHKVERGDKVVDATCGNGNDTLFLAELVGDKGTVFAFDILEKALSNTESLLKEKNMNERVIIINDSHVKMEHYIPDNVKLVLFNLGYLPGFEKSLTTNCKSTIMAIERALNLIKRFGLILIVVYQGHEEGIKEKKAIEAFLCSLDQKKFNTFHVNFPNQINFPPVVFGIERR